MNTVRTAIVGASGYAGEELVRLLLGHPHTDLTVATSRQYAGQTVAQIFPKFSHWAKAKSLRFTEPSPETIAKSAEVVFLALPHGVAAEYAAPLLRLGASVIDLSADFRLKDEAVYKEFYAHEHPAPQLLAQSVYGLPEVYRSAIRNADFIACPGCYPTSILLPLIPLLRAKLIRADNLIADSMSGVTGAGRKVEADYLFAECNESLRAYGIPKHRHLSELEQELSAAAGAKVVMQFTPHLVPVNRGILTTIYTEPLERVSDDLAKKISGAYESYANEPFVRIVEGKALPDTKNVVGTNFIEIGWRLDPRTNRLILMSAEDNIVKGTSGQAIQCFNIRSGFPETTGLI